MSETTVETDGYYEILGKCVDNMSRDELLYAVKILIRGAIACDDAKAFNLKLKEWQTTGIVPPPTL